MQKKEQQVCERIQKIISLGILLCGGWLVSGCVVLEEKYNAEKARSLNFQRLLTQEEKRTAELFLFGLDIDLGEQEGPAELIRQFFEGRAEAFARPAPLGPEIQQYRGLLRTLQHLGLEGLGGGIEDVRGGGGHAAIPWA